MLVLRSRQIAAPPVGTSDGGLDLDREVAVVSGERARRLALSGASRGRDSVRTIVTMALIILIGGLGACSGRSTSTASRPSTSAPTIPTAHPALAPLPKQFPKPAHSVVIQEHFKGRNDEYELKVTTMSSAMRFWAGTLPKHGWTVKRAHLKGPLKFIFFQGHGYGRGKHTSKNINRTVVNTLDPHSHHVVVVFHKLK
jgi:hypothetical protein